MIFVIPFDIPIKQIIFQQTLYFPIKLVYIVYNFFL